MTTDHLTPEQEAEAPLFFGDGGSGWGFGVGVVARRDDVSATPGSPRRDGSRSGWVARFRQYSLMRTAGKPQRWQSGHRRYLSWRALGE